MNTYQLLEKLPKSFNAGGKAPSDINSIAEKSGFKTITFFHWGERKGIDLVLAHFKRFYEWFFLLFRIKRNSVLFMQFPYIRGGRLYRLKLLKLLKLLKNVKIITLIHDVNELRYENFEKEKILLDDVQTLSDILIVHNEKMSHYFQSVRNIPEEKLVELKVFDYLTGNSPLVPHPFKKAITIAGNLDTEKCAYLSSLTAFKNIKFHLYGKNCTLTTNENIIYHGGFDSEEIISHIKYGFGLVWDGDSSETCSGYYGNYLAYNNPHKFSMYLAAGLPVIVWKNSALSSLVAENKIGLCVSSIAEAVERITVMQPEEYNLLTDNCIAIAQRLRSGFYTENALKESLSKLVR